MPCSTRRSSARNIANPTTNRMAPTPPHAELIVVLESIQTLMSTTDSTDGPRPPTNDSGKSVSISKLLPRFPGFGYAYDHIERLKQICRVYEPIKEVTKVTTFRLTLDDQAGVWFRTLNEDIVTDFEYVIKDFLTNFARRGSKWNLIDQLFSLKQEASEMVKDYIRRMKTRCRM